MKIPAIRAKIGVWVYYVATMSFTQISDHVKKIDDELHKSVLLSEMLQRSITDNFKSISNYIIQQEERFFNALVLAIYDGDPQWHEVVLEYTDGDEFSDLGILELTGQEKIFPIDGQHRVEGIKRTLIDHPELSNEKIAVIFVGHKKDESGMKRSRRMFSTLNRYAKPVSLRDIIALDEDDSIAISCRYLMENNGFFSAGRILDSKNKAISEKNKEFTTIITFYECNLELLNHFIEFKSIQSFEGRNLKGRSKLKEYIRYRPSEEDIVSFNVYVDDFWRTFIKSFEALNQYSLQREIDSQPYRNKEGGSLLFRPTSLLAIVKASIFIKKKTMLSFEEVFSLIARVPLELSSKLWINVLWNPSRKIMLTTNSKIVESLIVYCVDKSLLSGKDIERLYKDLQALLALTDSKKVIEHLDMFLLKN